MEGDPTVITSQLTLDFNFSVFVQHKGTGHKFTF